MFCGRPAPIRDLFYTAVALAFCGVVLWLDVQTNSDITEAYLYPLAFIAVCMVKRDWATYLVAAVAIIGTLAPTLLKDPGDSFEAMVVNRAMTIVVIVGIAFLLKRVSAAHWLLARIATIDSLTGIFNRGHFMALLAREQQRADRYGTSFAFLMLDIDHFKRVNDTYGHPVGDEALKAMAEAASKFLRPTDTIGRFGGEEFVVLLPHTDEAGAVRAAERIRESVAQVVVPAAGPEMRLTVSVGATTYVRKTRLDQLLAGADRALYVAKAGGRNRVCVGPLAPSGLAAA
jgi:diguanylate cyclase (GGDEF)-like protein